MNLENTNLKYLKETSFKKSVLTKSVALSLSLLLGACAATGVKKEAPPPVKKVELEVEQKTEQAPAPSAAELMKTLKAPVVAPPEDVVKPKPKPVQVAAEAAETKQALAKKAEAASIEAQKQADLAKAAMVAAAEAEAKAKAAAEQAAAEKAAAEKVAVNPVVQTASVAKAEKVSAMDAKPFNISAKKLPFNYDIWTIRQGNTPLTKGLVIATPTWEMGKEGYMSQIWLTMMEDRIHVNSSSDIETASKGLGIRIDGGDLIPFTSIAENNIGVIDGKWLDQLASANKIDIYLGFFPGKKPTSETFKSDLSLDNLARIVATYRMLNR